MGVDVDVEVDVGPSLQEVDPLFFYRERIAVRVRV